jgi:nucleoside phosphorylase/HEAT repeat protein
MVSTQIHAVDFGIITIREDEFVAVFDRLPKPFETVTGERIYNLHQIVFADGSSYTIATVRCAQQGNGEAQQVANAILHDLEPRWLLVVGIAGGAPAMEFTLGDVIVATEVADFNVGSATAAGTRQYALTGWVTHPAAQKHVANLPALSTRLGPWNTPKSIGQKRPGVDLSSVNFCASSEWNQKVRETLEVQFKDPRRKPKVTAGAIACSDLVVKDADLFHSWLQWFRQAKAVEMESAGVHRAAHAKGVPFLSIRGLSDIIGFKRDDLWVAYACHTAAAFTVAFLKSKPLEPLGADEAERGASKVDSHRLTLVNAAAHKHIERQLGSPHFALKYDSQHYVPRAIETDIEKWLAAPSSPSRSCCFLILAPAGCGKTNLLCRVATRSAARHPTFLFAGAQLRIDEQLGLWGALHDVLREITDIERERSTVQKALTDGASFGDSTRIVVVLDAINEFHDPIRLKREIRLFLEEVQALPSSAVSVIIACRDYYWGLFDAPWWSAYLKVSDKTLPMADDERRSTKRVLGNFTPEEATAAFSVYFASYGVSAQPEGNAREQFRHPLLLRFFCETYRGQHLGLLKDIRLKDLFDRYWAIKLESIAERMIDQGELAFRNDIGRHVGQCVLDIARCMLQQNTRAISVQTASYLARGHAASPHIQTPYARILDEHIILEELSGLRAEDETMIAFVFEEFMEYAMARSLIREWRHLQPSQIGERVLALTRQVDDFSQVLGVMLYAGLMLREELNVALWPVLIGLGTQWERVVIQAFRRIPIDQIDDGVFQAIVELLSVPRKEIRIEALELLKFGRLKRIPTQELIDAVGELVSDSDLRIRRRAIHALASCPSSFAVPLIERAVTTPMRRIKDEDVIVHNAMRTLAKLGTDDAIALMARTCGAYQAGKYGARDAIALLGPRAEALLQLVDHDDLLTRLGAINILQFSESRSAITVLERVVQTAPTQTWTAYIKEFPAWLNRRRRRWLLFLFSLENKDPVSLEALAAKEALSELRKTNARLNVDELWRSRISAVLKTSGHSGLPVAAETLDSWYKNDRLITFILKAGLEYRSGRKWDVRGSWRGFKIKAPRSRLQNGQLTVEDRTSLAELLSIPSVSPDGVSIPNGSRDYDYWKEYIYRAWGVPPEVFGKTEPYWD